MARERIIALLVEDNPDDVLLIQRQIDRTAGSAVELEWVERCSAGLERLAQGGVDVLLLDLRLPDSDGIDTLWKFLARFAEVPVIVLTTLDDQDLALRAIKRGAQDYIGKTAITGEVLLRSITYAIERKQLQVQLERSADDLERSNQELKRFAVLAAQNLQRPLRTIYELWSSLRNEHVDKPGGPAREQLAAARQDIERMQRLVDDLVIYTSLEFRGSPEEQADSESILAEVVESLKGEIAKSGAKVTHDRSPIVAMGTWHMRQLLRNLLENAIKFRREIPPEIHVGVEQETGQWIFSVRDNGLGIEPDYPGQIFEVFVQLNPRVDDPGTGIGLAICKRVVENHGGEIWVESKPGEGSTFYFTVPREE